jgi:hypothetical protein
MSNNTLDAGIPVLTEVIPVPELPVAAPPTVLVLEPAPVRDDARWEQLEQDVRERVLVQVMARIDRVLEQRVRDCLADVLQSSVERLATELREGLRISIKEAVNRAVTQELDDLQRTVGDR